MPTFDITANRSYPLPHANNDLELDVDRLRSALSAIDTDIATVLSGLATKANASHTHVISDVSGLQTALDLKLAASSVSGAAANLLDDPSVSAMRDTLGLGDAATKGTGTSGAKIPMLDGSNTWSLTQIFGSGSGASLHYIDGGPGSNRTLAFRSAGNNRFGLGLTATGESGNNSGSDFYVRRYSDAGALLDTPISIDRTSGEVTINHLSSVDVSITGGDIFGVGNFVFNHSVGIQTIRGFDDTAVTPGMQAHGGSPVNSTLGLFNWGSVDAFGLIMSRARGGSIGNPSSINGGDLLGSITFAGSDGQSFRRSSMISAEADAAPGSGRVQGRLRFYVMDNTGSFNELLRLNGKNNIKLLGGITETFLRSNAASGSSIQPTSAVSTVVYDRVSTSAALTLRLPTTDVENGQKMKFFTRSAITALTTTVEGGAGADVFGAPSSMGAGEAVDFIYYSSGPYWIAGK